MSRAVEISEPRPTFAPSIRIHIGVSPPAYSGNSQVRASSSRRSVAQIDTPAAERIGWCPGEMARASRRVSTSTASATAAKPASAASGSHGRAASTACPKVSAPRRAGSSTAPPTSTPRPGSAAISRDSAP